jgi:hypothetical protein
MKHPTTYAIYSPYRSEITAVKVDAFLYTEIRPSEAWDDAPEWVPEPLSKAAQRELKAVVLQARMAGKIHLSGYKCQSTGRRLELPHAHFLIVPEHLQCQLCAKKLNIHIQGK